MSFWRSLKGIRNRLLLISIAPILIVAAALFWLVLSNQNDMLNRSLINSGESTAAFLAATAELSMYAEDRASLEKLGRSALRFPSTASVGFINNSNKLIAVTGDFNVMTSRYIKPCIEQSSLDIHAYLYICKPIMASIQELSDFGSEENNENNLEQEQYGWVVLAISREELFLQEQTNLYIISSITLSVVLIISILALRIGHSISAPILSLEQTVNDLGAGNYDSKAQEVGPIETQTLARGINSLAATVATSQEQLEERVKDATQQLILALKNIGDKNTDLEKAQQDLTSAMAAKDQFLARMSHELRTPLTAIAGFSRLLQRSEMDDTQKQYSGNIVGASDLLMGTIDGILDFSKLQEKALSIETIDFDLRDAMESLLAMQACQAHSKSLELVLIIDHDVPIHLQGDPTRIKQVINNLLSNAIKFTHQGEVILHITVLEDHNDKARLSFQVKDSGIGMSKENQNRLFKPFSQADHSITRRFGGTGLGLVICKQLLDLMDGTISINSELNQGSTFFVELPLAKNKAPKPTTTTLVANSGNPFNIAAFEPNSWTRWALRSVLTHWNGKVFTYSSEQRLLARLGKDNSIDLVIFGLAPNSTDNDYISQQLADIREQFAGPIVILNSYSEWDNHFTEPYWHEAAPIHHLSRPLRQHVLFNKLQQLKGEKPAGNTKPTAIVQHLKGLQILIAEDNQYSQHLIQLLLELLGADVITANNGEEAIKQFKQHSVDVVLMDIHMPVMDGIAATACIAELAGDEGIPIIGLTANIMKNERQALFQAGATDILFKPLDEQQLIKTITELVGRTLSKNDDKTARLLDTVASKDSLKDELNRLVQTLEQAISSQQQDNAAEIIHEMLGLSGMFGTEDVTVAINQLRSELKTDAAQSNTLALVATIKTTISKL